MKNKEDMKREQVKDVGGDGVFTYRNAATNRLMPFIWAKGQACIALKEASISIYAACIDGLPLISYPGRKKVFIPIARAIQWHQAERATAPAARQDMHQTLIDRMETWSRVLGEQVEGVAE